MGADGDWSVVNDIASDATFAASIDVIGSHYPCNGGDGSDATTCPSPANAQSLGKPLWASENGSEDFNAGAAAIARAFVRGYVDGRMTSFINWPLVAAIPPALPFETVGLMLADAPWSGGFVLGKSVWVFAQVTQFAQVGWSFIDSASGLIAGDRTKGSYVTLKSAGGADYTAIIETTAATGPQTLAFAITGGLSTGPVHVWGTSVAAGDTSTNLVHVADVTPSGGTYWVTLAPGFLYSLTTTSGQSAGQVPSPPLAAAALPYEDDFEGRAVGTPPRYLCDQDGSFEVAACGAGRTGQCLRQAAPATPIEWATHFGTPYTIVGTNEWRDYVVSADILLEQAGSAELLGRFGGRGYYDTGYNDAYDLSVSDTGAWAIFKNDQTAQTKTSLASGSVASFGTMSWHTVSLSMQGSSLSATIDGALVGTATDTAYGSGPAGLAVGVASGGWVLAQFDNFHVSPLAPVATPYTYQIGNRASGTVLDVTGQSTADGAPASLGAPSSATSQEWQLEGDGTGTVHLVNVNSGKALAAATSGGTPAQQPVLSSADQAWQLEPTSTGSFRILSSAGLALSVSSAPDASSAPALAPADCSVGQEWFLTVAPAVQAGYSLMNRGSQLLLDVVAAATTQGASIDVWPPTGGANQAWVLAKPGGAGTAADTFLLVSRNSGMVLDVPAASTTAGTALEQWPPTGGGNQSWRLSPTGDGYYVVTGGDGLVLDTQAGGLAKGTLVVQSTVSGSATPTPTQEWALIPAP